MWTQFRQFIMCCLFFFFLIKKNNFHYKRIKKKGTKSSKKNKVQNVPTKTNTLVTKLNPSKTKKTIPHKHYKFPTLQKPTNQQQKAQQYTIKSNYNGSKFKSQTTASRIKWQDPFHQLYHTYINQFISSKKTYLFLKTKRQLCTPMLIMCSWKARSQLQITAKSVNIEIDLRGA